MKKLSYLLCALFLMVPVMVNAVIYKSYKIGDEVDLNGYKYHVVVDSDENSSKLVLLGDNIMGISNTDELWDECGRVALVESHKYGVSNNNVYFDDFEPACFMEKAKMCTVKDGNCDPLLVPFEYNYDVETVTYSETSQSNIGYIMKNLVLPVLKTETKENLTTARLLTGDETVAIYKTDNTTLATAVENWFKNYSCQLLSGSTPKKNIYGETYMPEEYQLSNKMDWLFISNNWWINTTKYSGKCWEAGQHNEEYYLDFTYAENYRNIRPVIELEKTDVIYTITTKTDGNGTVVASASQSRGDEDITFEVTPNKGYVLDHVAVTDNNGNTVIFEDYKFTMPNADVVIEARFVAENPDTLDNIGLYMTMFGIGAGLMALAIAKKKVTNR